MNTLVDDGVDGMAGPEQERNASVGRPPRVVVVGDRRADDASGMEQDILAAPAEIVAHAWYGDEATQAIEAHNPEAVIVDLAPSIDASIKTLREVTAQWPALAIVVVPPEGGALAARSLVVSDRVEIIDRPLRPWTLASALARMVPEADRGPAGRAPPSPPPTRARIVAVIGAKGGVGATTFAVNLSVALRQAGAKRVSLVDLNVQQGDVALATDIVPSRSIADLAGEGERL